MYNESGVRTLTASGPIDQFLRVIEIGGKVQVASDTDIDIGTANRPTFQAGDDIPVKLRNASGTVIMIADGPIPAGFQVYAAVNGKVSQAGTSLVGIAQTEAAVDGDQIEVQRIGGTGSGGGAGLTLPQVRQVAVGKVGTAPFANLAAANAALTSAVPAGEMKIAVAAGQLLAAFGGDSSFTALGSATGGDALYQIAARTNSTENVAPTVAELTAANGGTAPTVANGHDATIPLADGRTEFWLFTGGAWARQRIAAVPNIFDRGDFTTLAAANSGQTWPVPAGQTWIATAATGHTLVARAAATAFTAYGGAGGDALYQIAARTNSTESVAPTVAELTAANGGTAPTVANGHDATIPLADGRTEFWLFTSNAWARQRISTIPTAAGTYRAGAATGPNRNTAPVATDVTSAALTALVAGSVIFRDVMGIEQRWLVNNAGVAVLDREFMPDDATPLSAVPSVAAGTGWNVGDRFTYRDTSSSPTLYKKYVVSVIGPLRVPVLESYSGGGSGGATNLTNTPNATGILLSSSSGTGTTLPLATGTSAGLLGPGIIHPTSGGAALPATSNRVGELFQRTGSTAPGTYTSTDLVGGWVLLGTASTNNPPTVATPIPDRTSPANVALTAFSIAANFADSNSDPLTFTATGLPAGVTLATNGTFSGTPTTNSTNTVVVTANDGKGGTVSDTFIWTINTAAITASGTITATGDGSVASPFRMTANGTASTPNASQTLNLFRWTITFTDQGGRVVVVQGAPGAAPTTVTDTASLVVVADIVGTSDSFYIDATSNDIWGDVSFTLRVEDTGGGVNTLT